MTRLLAIFLLLTGSALAQTQPEPQNPPKPKPGTIVPRPESGRIVSEPTPAPTATVTATGVLTGQPIERFEAVGNTSVASDTIRVYLGIVPGEPYNPDLIQKNFLNLWQTGLETGEKKIVFNVNEGIKATVSRIDFVGNKRFSSRRLRAQMKEVKPNNIISWIRKKNLYIPSKLDEDLENVKNYYMDYGYTNIAFGEPQITTFK